MTRFIVSMYAKGERKASDCLPDYFASRADAIEAASQEVCRVMAMPPESRDPTMDWAHRFTIRAIR